MEDSTYSDVQDRPSLTIEKFLTPGAPGRSPGAEKSRFYGQNYLKITYLGYQNPLKTREFASPGDAGRRHGDRECAISRPSKSFISARIRSIIDCKLFFSQAASAARDDYSLYSLQYLAIYCSSSCRFRLAVNLFIPPCGMYCAHF